MSLNELYKTGKIDVSRAILYVYVRRYQSELAKLGLVSVYRVGKKTRIDVKEDKVEDFVKFFEEKGIYLRSRSVE